MKTDICSCRGPAPSGPGPGNMAPMRPTLTSNTHQEHQPVSFYSAVPQGFNPPSAIELGGSREVRDE